MRYSFVADHFQYLASLGLIALICAAAGLAVVGLPSWSKGFTATLVVVVLTMLGSLTWHQTHTYRDLGTLWRDTLEKNPRAWMAHNNLGRYLELQGHLERSAAHYRKAIRLKPDHAVALNNLGIVLQRRGEIDEAIACYIKAAHAGSGFAAAHYNAGAALRAVGRVDSAVEHFRQALRLRPDWLEPLNGLAWILATSASIEVRDAVEAVALARRAAALSRHHDPRVLDTLAAAHAAAGRFERAAAIAEDAQRLAIQTGDDRLAGGVGSRLDLYRQAKVFVGH